MFSVGLRDPVLIGECQLTLRQIADLGPVSDSNVRDFSHHNGSDRVFSLELFQMPFLVHARWNTPGKGNAIQIIRRFPVAASHTTP